MESPSDELQVAEQITLYESKIRGIKQKIREELQIRRDLKAKIDDAKKKEALQIQILERLEEFEKIVTKQIELSKNQEDSDSLKMKAIIQKYEKMLEEQQDVWAKYEEKYERIPLAQEKRKLENSLKKKQIEIQVIQYKINDAKKNMRLLEKINKRQEQLEIIELARTYVEYKKKEKRFEELYKKEESLKNKKKELQTSIEYLKQKAVEKGKLMNQSLIKTQQLPEIDLSRFAIRKNNSNYDLNFDNVSINSYMLEQEYMNVDDQEESPAHSQDQENNSKKKKNHVSKVVSDPMEYKSSEESSNLNKSKPKHKKVEFDLGEANNTIKSNRASQESLMESMELDDQTPKKIVSETVNPNQMQHNNDEISTFVISNNNNMEYLNSQINQERPVPTPAKMMRHSSQEQQKMQMQQDQLQQQQYYHQQMLQFQQQYQQQNLQHNQTQEVKQYQDQEMKQLQQQHLIQQHQEQQLLQKQHLQQIFQQQQRQLQQQMQQQQMQQQQQQQQHLLASRKDVDQRNYNVDSSRQAPQSSKPTIKSIEPVNYPNISKSHKQKTPMSENQLRTPSASMQMKPVQQQETPSGSSMINLLASPVWEANIPPGLIKPNVEDPRVMGDITSTSMMSTDLNFYQDNISAILGSEITEPGGSFELKKRLYADSDLNSENGEIDYEKLYGEFCSPIGQKQQVALNNSNAQLMNENNDSAKPNSQEAAKNFTLGQFVPKQPHNRFF